MWEKYHLSVLKSCNKLPKIFVNHREMLLDPYGALLRFHRDWTKMIVSPSTLEVPFVNRLNPPDYSFVMKYMGTKRR